MKIKKCFTCQPKMFQFDYDFQSYETLKSRENIFQKINGA
jgi:hypothetical protein